MKTPREILLEQHRPAELKLDEIRQRIIATELATQSAASSSVPSPFKVQSFGSFLLWPLRILARLPVKLWMELVWPCRRIWAGLTAVWALVILLNLDYGGPTSGMATNHGPTRNPWSMAALKEQQQIMSQLLDADAPAFEPAPKPGPRGEIEATAGWAMEDGHPRSAELHSAVSPGCTRQGVEWQRGGEISRAVAGLWPPQTTSLRYSRVQLCATPDRARASPSGSQCSERVRI